MGKINILEKLINQGLEILKQTTIKREVVSFSMIDGSTKYRNITVLAKPDTYIAWKTSLELFLKQNDITDLLVKDRYSLLAELKTNLAKVNGILDNWKMLSDANQMDTTKIICDSILDCDFPIIAKTTEEKKLEKIWNEMQFQLSIQNTPYSLGGMLRVLLELSTDYYMQKNLPTESLDKSLNKKISLVSQSLKDKGLINNTQEKTLNGNASLNKKSILDSFLHDLNGHPARQSLEAIWGNYKNYIVICLQN